LAELAKHRVPEQVHGAGGKTTQNQAQVLVARPDEKAGLVIEKP